MPINCGHDGTFALELLQLNGRHIAYRIDGDPTTPRPWMVFCHALGHDHTMWDEQVRLFGRACNVLRYDLRGHGASSNGGDVSVDMLADDLRALLDALAIKRCHLVGSCLGGMVAQTAAVRAPMRFISVTLTATAGRCTPVMRQALEERMTAVRSPLGIAAVIDITLNSWFTAAYFAQHAGQVAEAVKVLRRTSLPGYIACLRAMHAFDLTTRLVALDLPMLVVAGADDRLTPPSVSEEITHALRHAKQARIAHGAHLSNVECAEAFNAELKRFLVGDL
jgi:3-oxoadipate enol-lactonase